MQLPHFPQSNCYTDVSAGAKQQYDSHKRNNSDMMLWSDVWHPKSHYAHFLRIPVPCGGTTGNCSLVVQKPRQTISTIKATLFYSNFNTANYYKKRNLYGILTLKSVGQCAPVRRLVVDTHICCLVEIQLDPVGRRSVEWFWQLKRLFSVLQPDHTAVSLWCPPCQRNVPQVTIQQPYRLCNDLHV